MTLDYESLETLLGNRFRVSDNYDMDRDLFFPVSFLDRLFHFAQDLATVENRRDSRVKVQAFGRYFDIWVDDMVAKTRLHVNKGDNGAVVRLIDVACMKFLESGEVYAHVDGVEHLVTDEHGFPLRAYSPDDLALEIETSNTFDSEFPETLEYLASFFIRAAAGLKTEVNNTAAPRLADMLFDHFKFDLVPLVPDLFEDLSLIADRHVFTLTLTTARPV